MAYSTTTSRVVPHRSTMMAVRSLTSRFGWDVVHSTSYGRRRQGGRCNHFLPYYSHSIPSGLWGGGAKWAKPGVVLGNSTNVVQEKCTHGSAAELIELPALETQSVRQTKSENVTMAHQPVVRTAPPGCSPGAVATTGWLDPCNFACAIMPHDEETPCVWSVLLLRWSVLLACPELARHLGEFERCRVRQGW